MPSLLNDVRPAERRGALAAFLGLFGILASHTLLETARDALFLARLPATQLPWVYLAMAGVAVALAQEPGRLVERLTGRRGLALLLTGSSLVTFGFWWLGAWQSPWLLRALYVWTGVVSTLATMRFWLILGEQYDLGQAKRLFRIIGVGSLLGALAGGALARLIAAAYPAERLVLASAVVLALTGLGPGWVLRRPEAGARAAASGTSLAGAVRLLKAQPYVRGLASLVLVSSVTVTLVDYVFKSAVASRVAPGDLGVFFATVYLGLSLAALLVQLVLLGWLLRSLGLHRALLGLPILVAFGAVGVAFGGGLLAALLLKVADGALRPSLHRTCTELLFVPLSDSLRARAKPLIDVVGQRGGQALASVGLLAAVVLGRGDAVLAAGAAGLSLLWIALTVDLKQHYLDLFRAALRQGALRDRVDLAHLDLASLETLFAALNSREDAEVVGAMDLLAAGQRTRLIPALVLFHPSRDVVLRALELFADAGRDDFVPVADRLLDHADPEVRAAALRARTAVCPDASLLQRAVADPHPLVRATAWVGLATGPAASPQALAGLRSLVESDAPGTRLFLAHAIRVQPAPVFDDLLLRLAEVPAAGVEAQVARAMGARRNQRFLSALLQMLGSGDARPEARKALRAFDEDGVRLLDEALSDQALPHEIRRHIPRSLTVFPGRWAAPVLLEHLLGEPDGMVRFKVLRALGRIVTREPGILLDDAVLRKAAGATLEAAFRLVHWRLVLEQGVETAPARATPGHELLSTLLRDKEVHATERLFRLLALIFRGEDFKRIHRGLESPDPKVRAGSRELIEYRLDAPLRDGVLALVDDVPAADRVARAVPFYVPRPMGYEELLSTILGYPSETLRSIVAYHVGELGLSSFRGRLEAFAPHDTGFFVARVIEKALHLLGPTPEPLPDAR